MSKYFNYKRAWDEYVKGEFEKLPAEVHKALNATRVEVDVINQIGATKTVTGQSKELIEMFDSIPSDILAWAHEVVYYYGYLAYDRQCQDGGLYWKFQSLVSMSLINRKPYNGEVMIKARIRMDIALKTFYDHEENTEYSDEEVPEFILKIAPEIEEGIVKIYKVDHVNHKPDMFCIGSEHISKSPGMFLDPNVAPCAHCYNPYSTHTSDRVMFLQPVIKDGENPDEVLNSKKDSIKRVLTRIIEICTAAKIKIDGFAFIKISYKTGPKDS